MPVNKPVAVVGLGAIMPDAEDAASFWENIKTGRYSISEVPEDRWNVHLYYDPNPTAVDKTYSKIGGWVRNFTFEPFKWGIAIPPRVLLQMDDAQKWSIAATRQALVDYGYPNRALDLNRTAVIIGNALGGDKHYVTSLRIRTPEFMTALSAVPEFQNLPASLQQALLEGMRQNIRQASPEINEDTMPGELSNIIAGRVANVFNFQGPNFVTDAACASSLAALQAAVDGLNDYQFDTVVTGGVDAMMGIDGFVKFCKIGALSPDGSRPYADGANGFVMGQGAAVFLLKRLEDAERDGDRIYAVVRGIGGSSDGKGKGITAPNPTGQQQAIERAWKSAGVSPETAGLIEGHGTSTRVGDVVEVNSLNAIFGQFGLPSGKIALGSVKSNIGHLKSAAGAAGMFKVVMALHEKVLPPSVNFERPNPNIDFAHIPFAVNTRLRPWEVKQGDVRRAGVSSFGFGGTNFHVVIDEYIPGILSSQPKVYAGVELASSAAQVPSTPPEDVPVARAAPASLEYVGSLNQVKPYRGLLFLGADTVELLKDRLAAVVEEIRLGKIPESAIPSAAEIQKPERLAIDYGDPDELLKRAERALKGFESEGNPWQALVAHGVFRGHGAPGKIAFLFPGQGSQYANMLKDLCEVEPVVADTFKEADAVMTPILGRSLTSYIYVDGDEAALAEAEKALRNTEITQPAMLTANVAMLRLMKRFGFEPDMVIGHSLGEYAALVASGVLSFAEALQVVSARGREMKKVTMDDNGCMAAVSAPLERVEEIIGKIDGYVVIANINSPTQCVVGGTTAGVDAALEAFKEAGFQGTKIPVSHAFHTRIVAPASGPLSEVIARMNVQLPKTTIVANVTGDVYPTTREEIIQLLADQVASPVQFVKGVNTLYRLGGRVFVEIGPKRVLNALATDILKGKEDVAILATNHPREGAVVSYNKALCGLLAAGIVPTIVRNSVTETPSKAPSVSASEIKEYVLQMVSEKTGYPTEMLDLDLDLEADLGIDTVKQAELFAAIRTHYDIPRREDLRLADYSTLNKVIGFMQDALKERLVGTPAAAIPAVVPAPQVDRGVEEIKQPIVSNGVRIENFASPQHGPLIVKDGHLPLTGSVVISGAGLGLPGRNGSVFNDRNVESLLRGEIRIEQFPEDTRNGMLEKRVTRLIKSEAGAIMQPIDQLDQTVKLGGQRGQFNLTDEFGVPADRVEATDISTQLAIAAGIEALRDAGIPLVMGYRKTSKGTYLPDRWKLPEALADETGVVFGSAFPGLDEMAAEAGKFYEYQGLANQLTELENLLALVPTGQPALRTHLEQRMSDLRAQLSKMDYHFDRRFVFRILSMGHSQFAEYIGARGPNTHVNAACATTTHALAVAEDWIRTGRARRVIVVAGDDVTSGPLSNWVGTGLMASGAATIEGDPRKAILPFDRRRNGMIMGMGAAALVVESEDAVRERGMRAICEVLATQIANSAFHGTRLDIQHVSEVMERLIAQAEERYGVQRQAIAASTVFVSHETYTPARGGSAAAEIHALRSVFGDQANQVVIANTKGYTGHTMGVGVEDVMAVKALEAGIVPPIANIDNGFEPDPDLGDLRLSKGGHYDVEYALRLGAGFGSQIAMTLMRKIAGVEERINRPVYNQWLANMAGYDRAELEVEKRTLRIRHVGPPIKAPAKSQWKFGQGPTLWAGELPEKQPVDDSSMSPAVAEFVAVAQRVEQTVMPTQQPEPTRHAANGAGIEDGAIKTYVLQVVSEKTGYPVEMLDLELDLEADLGIDTVKQAELFATIRTHYDIPRREDLRLADYNTLEKVIGFMKEALAGKQDGGATPLEALSTVALDQPAQTVEPLPVDLPAATSQASGEEIKTYVLNAVSEKTGYPVEMLDLDLDLEADLGIDTVKQAELFATIRTHYAIPRREDLRLADYNTLAKVIQFMQDALTVSAPAAEQPARVETEDPLPVGAVSSQPEAAKPAAAIQPDADSAAIKDYVLSAVSEKTGYPVEMLDLELDLEADLGIDTVKQAELFATIRTHYAIPRREDLRLADYNTLAKVIQFMSEALAAKGAETVPASAVSREPAVQDANHEPATGHLEMLMQSQPDQAIRRRVAVPVLRPRLDLCTPTGVELGESSRVVVVADQGKVAESLLRRLRGRKVQVLSVDGNEPVEALRKVAEFAGEGPVHGLYCLSGLDVEPTLAEMDGEQWNTELEKRSTLLFSLLKAIPGEPFVVSATRMGGLNGYCESGASSPMGGLLSGLTKALSWERPSALVKTVDFEVDANPSTVAARLVVETLSDPAVVEVGWKEDLRFSYGMKEQPLADEADLELSSQSVYVVSGGSGGITAPVVLDLAKETGGTYYLLSRTSLPNSADPDLKALQADRNAFKAEMGRRLREMGEKATPAAVDQKIAGLERGAATLEMIAAAEKAGARVHYLVCDVTDADSCSEAISTIVRKEGKVDVFIHAAGLERSRKLDTKPVEEFKQVVAVKANGFFNLFKAMQARKALPKAVVFFSSVAGRFGNNGQTDYSAVNDLLGKIGSALPALYPGMKSITIDWGAWAEVGMASRGYIPELMKRAGIEMMHPAAAAPLVRHELAHGKPGSEVIYAGSLGLMETPRRPDGGLDLESANRALTQGRPLHIMLTRATGLDLNEGVILEADLDPSSEPFLRDHALNGIPLLPGVMGIEGLSTAARHIASRLASEKGSFRVSALENIEFMAPFKFYKNQPRRVTWKAKVVREDERLVAYASLESSLTRYGRDPEKMLHFTAKVYLLPVGEPLEEMSDAAPHWNGSQTITADEIYKLYFHGPSFQVLEAVQREEGQVVGKLRHGLPALTNENQDMSTPPALVELVLQTAGVWEIGTTGVMALPRSIGSLRVYRVGMNGTDIYAEVKPHQDEDQRPCFDARVVDAKGRVYLELENYRTEPLPYSVEKEKLEALQHWMRSVS